MNAKRYSIYRSIAIVSTAVVTLRTWPPVHDGSWWDWLGYAGWWLLLVLIIGLAGKDRRERLGR